MTKGQPSKCQFESLYSDKFTFSAPFTKPKYNAESNLHCNLHWLAKQLKHFVFQEFDKPPLVKGPLNRRLTAVFLPDRAIARILRCNQRWLNSSCYEKKFSTQWLNNYSWLQHDSKIGMLCELYICTGKQNNKCHILIHKKLIE